MELLLEFWRTVVEVWNQGVLGVNIGRVLTALLIFLGFLLFRRVFTSLIMNRLAAMAAKTKTHLDDEALEILKKPLSLIPVVVGLFFAFEYLPLAGLVEQFADRLVRSLIVLIIFWSFVNLVQPLTALFRRLEQVFSVAMVEWLIKAVKIALIFIGTATVLDVWGIEIGPILAGLGLFGVAVALGAQDLFKNLISGILIIAERRFNPGDWVKVDGVVEGTVESIGFRSTLVRRFDKAPVYVPNARLSDSSVINFTKMTHRRIYWIIGVEYRTTVDQLRQIRDNIEKYIFETDVFALPPAVPTFVRIDQFSDSSIDIMVYCFTKTTAWGEWLEIKEALACRIKDIVEQAGASFAFPSQSLYIESISGDPAEVFIPPAEGQPASPAAGEKG